MASDLVYGLLPDHLLLALLLVYLVLELVDKSARFAGVLLNLTLIGVCAVLYMQYRAGYNAAPIANEIRVDDFAVLAKLVIAASGLLLAWILPPADTYKGRFLLASSLLGAMVIVDSAGFVSLFIGIEMLSLPAFALMIHGAGETPASEAAFKYLLLSSVATALLLFGVALAYGATGSLAIDVFARSLAAQSPLAVAAATLISSGLFIKAAVFPFHAWAPDAYSGARLPVTGFLASIVKGAVIFALVRVFAEANLGSGTVAILAVLSIASIFYGNFAAIRQGTLKRLIAYSSIAHAGYMLFAFVAGPEARTENLLWYVAIYAATVIIACASFAVLCGRDDDSVASLDGRFEAHPVAAVVFGLAMLSLAGIPPLPGFFAKLLVFRSVVAADHLVPAVIAFVGSFIGVTYYLGLFFRPFTSSDKEARDSALPRAGD